MNLDEIIRKVIEGHSSRWFSILREKPFDSRVTARLDQNKISGLAGGSPP